MSSSYMQYLRNKMSDNKGGGVTTTTTEEGTQKALIDSTTNYRRKQPPQAQTSTGATTKLLFFLTIFFFLTTCGVTAVLLWREFTTRKSTTQPSSSILKVEYPGYFRTEDEQRIYEEQMMSVEQSELLPVNQSVRSPFDCSVNCYRGKGFPARRRKRQIAPGSMYHGCCVSNTHFTTPDTATSLTNVARTLVHTLELRQFFKVDNCSQAIGCTGCTCMQAPSITTAVVYKSGVDPLTATEIVHYEVIFIKIDGCCKCNNVGVPLTISDEGSVPVIPEDEK